MGKMKHIVAYVTGGSNGIGRAVAEKIICQGGKVAIADTAQVGAKFAECMGERCLFTCTDVRVEKEVIESLKCVKCRFGGINVLVNSAGVSDCESIYDFKAKKPHSAEVFKRVIDVNLWGLFNVTRLAVGLMAENKPDVNKQRGVIVNVSSMMGHEPSPGLIAYGASKSAVSGMTLPLARGVAEKGIRVVAVAPGFIDTNMTASIPPEDKKKCIMMNLTPKRFGTPDEVAHFIQTIIENPLINGEVLTINMAWRYCQTCDNPEEPQIPVKC